MATTHIEVLVEEPSMEAFLNAILPRIVRDGIVFKIHPFQGKQNLMRKLRARLSAYSKWMTENYRIVVVVDQDRDDCTELKVRMEDACAASNLLSRQASDTSNWQVVTRIAIEELEAWYFGDWSAVCKAYPRVSTNIPQQRKYRDPDAISNTWEALERILQRNGYFKRGLRKVEVATSIGTYFDPTVCNSNSFQKFRDAITEVGI
ncbi:DUF4276 family protein [Ruegeria sp.]|uniref:DUF4276 family protein n=1 Tax=Ruegeria sp. TaxID=1879320 RepID=UPI003B004786